MGVDEGNLRVKDVGVILEKLVSERIHVRNADRLVGFADQEDVMIVSVDSSHDTCLGAQCSSARLPPLSLILL